MIGKKILETLKERNMLQKELAEKVNITEAVLSRYISGDRKPNPEILANIATALNTTTDYLLGIENYDFDFGKIKRMIGRNSSKMSNEEKRDLINALFEDN